MKRQSHWLSRWKSRDECPTCPCSPNSVLRMFCSTTKENKLNWIDSKNSKDFQGFQNDTFHFKVFKDLCAPYSNAMQQVPIMSERDRAWLNSSFKGVIMVFKRYPKGLLIMSFLVSSIIEGSDIKYSPKYYCTVVKPSSHATTSFYLASRFIIINATSSVCLQLNVAYTARKLQEDNKPRKQLVWFSLL